MELVIPQHFLPSNYDNFLICEVEIKIPQPVLEYTSQSLEVANLWVLKQAELPQPIPNQGCLAMSEVIFIVTNEGLGVQLAPSETLPNNGEDKWIQWRGQPPQ